MDIKTAVVADELKAYDTAGVHAILDAAIAVRAAQTKRIAAIRAELRRRERSGA